MIRSLAALLMFCTFTAVGCSSVNEKDTIITETTQVMGGGRKIRTESGRNRSIY